MRGLRSVVAGLACLAAMATATAAQAQLAVEVTAPPERIAVGTTVDIGIDVHNAGAQSIGPVDIVLSDFNATLYDGAEGLGCDWIVSVADPPPGSQLPARYGFFWSIPSLPPGASATCTLRLPTRRAGTESVDVRSFVDGQMREEASFAYALLAPAQPVPALSSLALIFLVVCVGLIARRQTSRLDR